METKEITVNMPIEKYNDLLKFEEAVIKNLWVFRLHNIYDDWWNIIREKELIIFTKDESMENLYELMETVINENDRLREKIEIFERLLEDKPARKFRRYYYKAIKPLSHEPTDKRCP